MNCFALGQNREVFALPGKVDSETSFGTNALIEQEAKLVSSVDDILEEFNLTLSKDNRPCEKPPLATSELLLYDLISAQPIDLDEIVEKTNLSISTLSETLCKLQIKKLIRQLPGKHYIRSLDET